MAPGLEPRGAGADGIDECKVNGGNGPQLGFSAHYGDPERHGERARSSRVIVDEAIGFLGRHAQEPFLLNVWLNDTHATLDPDEAQLREYEPEMPFGPRGKHVGANAIYYAVATEADKQIGRLLAALDELGLRQNTVVIFSADNGPEDIFVRNAAHSGVGSPGPFRGRKRSLYEGGIRVPFLLRWPGGGGPTGALDYQTSLCAVDLYPTFCALAGVDMPRGEFDGEDMADVFRGASRERTTPLLWEYRYRVLGHPINKSPMLAIMRQNWKLLANPYGDRIELYDIPVDPMEVDNRAAEHPQVARQLLDELIAWQATLPPGPVDENAGSNSYPWPAAASPDSSEEQRD